MELEISLSITRLEILFNCQRRLILILMKMRVRTIHRLTKSGDLPKNIEKPARLDCLTTHNIQNVQVSFC